MKILKNKLDVIYDKRISLALASSFFILTTQFFILSYFQLFESEMANLVQLISKVVVGLFFLFTILPIIKRNSKVLVVSYSVSLFVFLSHYLLFPVNRTHMEEIAFSFLLVSILSFVYIMSIRNINIFRSIMEKTALYIFLIGLMLTLLIIVGKASLVSYSMAFGYYLLLPAVYYQRRFFIEKKLIYLIIVILSLLMILLLGSRGPLLSFGVYILLYPFINLDKPNYKDIFTFISLSIIAISVYVNYNKIILNIENFFDYLGIKSRSLTLLFSNSQEGIHLSGRDKIYELSISRIKDNPLFGLGITEDRSYGAYTHNVFLEILSGFGIVFGSIIIVLLLILMLIGLFKFNKQMANDVLVWISIGFVPLFVSNSYLISFQFWMLLGYLLRGVIYNENYIKIIENRRTIHDQS